jgi:hypothetical protein
LDLLIPPYDRELLPEGFRTFIASLASLFVTNFPFPYIITP